MGFYGGKGGWGQRAGCLKMVLALRWAEIDGHDLEPGVRSRGDRHRP